MKTDSYLLVVEDETFFMKKIVETLESRFNRTVLQAGTYQKALALADQYGSDIFLTLTDLSLPDKPRGEIVAALETRRMPTIIFTGEFRQAHRRRLAEKPHVLDYILKDDPQFLELLMSRIDRLQKNQDHPILVADDSSAMRQILINYLKKQRFPILQASDGETALALLKERNDIDLLITDYNMPGLTGFELTREIRQWGADRYRLIIIGISTEDDPDLPAQFLKMGANDFLQKPFSGEGLYQRIINNLEIMEQITELQELNETKNRFLGMAAHDLHNPINGILGLTRLLKDPAHHNQSSEGKQFLDLIESSAGQMKLLVNDLLDLSAIEKGELKIEKKNERVKQLIENRIRFFEPMAREKKQTLQTDLEDFEAPVDAHRFSQILDNLLSNAIKYSPPEKAITLELKAPTEKEDSGKVFTLRVMDEGPGLDKEDLQSLFRIFHQGQARPTAGEKSTGLGLAITRKVTESHGGTVEAENRPEGGACFTVTLPA